jgi:hypothetical protein
LRVFACARSGARVYQHDAREDDERERPGRQRGQRGKATPATAAADCGFAVESFTTVQRIGPLPVIRS